MVNYEKIEEISTSIRLAFTLGESFEKMKEKKLENFFSNRTFADLYILDENMALDYVTKKTEKIVEYLCDHGEYVEGDFENEEGEEELLIIKEVITQSLICSFRTWETNTEKCGKLSYSPEPFNSSVLSRYDTYETQNPNNDDWFDYNKNAKDFDRLMAKAAVYSGQ